MSSSKQPNSETTKGSTLFHLDKTSLGHTPIIWDKYQKKKKERERERLQRDLLLVAFQWNLPKHNVFTIKTVHVKACICGNRHVVCILGIIACNQLICLWGWKENCFKFCMQFIWCGYITFLYIWIFICVMPDRSCLCISFKLKLYFETILQFILADYI